MTSLQSTSYAMDLLPPEDTMDLASSPYRQADDIDLDLEQIGDSSLDPHPDSMFDDAFDDHLTASEGMQEDPNQIMQDDDMIEEDHIVHRSEADNHDFNMAVGHDHQRTQVDPEDEDILYEDDEDYKAVDEPPQTISEVKEETTSLEKQTSPELLPNIAGPDSFAMAHTPLESGDGLLDPEPTEMENAQNIGLEQDIIHDPPGTSQTEEQDHGLHAQDEDELVQRSETAKNEVNREAEQATQDFPEDDFPRDNLELDTTTPEDGNQHETTAQSSLGGHRPTPTETYLHPVKVIYQESEICLFPPAADDTSDTFFIPDTSLAYETLDKLLLACRDVLVGSIGEDDELVLDVASLGLHICEDSKYATQITLSQILDVYLALSHNEHIEQVEPLYCSLTSRVCLATQYAYLTASAQEGRTFSEISAEHIGSPEDSEAGPGKMNQRQTADEEQGQEQDTGFNADEAAGAAHLDDENNASNANRPGNQNELDDHSQTLLGGELGQHLLPEEDDQVNQLLGKEGAADGMSGDVQSSSTGDEAVTDDTELDASEAQTHRDDFVNSENLLADTDYDAEPQHGQGAENNADSEVHSQTGPQDGTTRASTETIEEQDSDEDDLNDQDPGDLDIDALLEEDMKNTDQKPVKDGDHVDANSFEEDLLDLGPEEKEPEAMNGDLQVEDPMTKAEEEHEDLFEEDDDQPSSSQARQNGGPVNGNNSSTSANPPATPAKVNGGKRKAPADVDDLDLLDFGTPDTKRRRPS